MSETTQEQEKKPGRRLLFNKTGMSYILRPAKEGEPRRVFGVGVAFEPIDDKEESDLLGYPGVVFADTIMPAQDHTADLAAARAKVKALTEENEELKKLKGSIAGRSKPQPKE